MEAIDIFIAHIQKKVSFTEEELATLTAAFQLKKVRKKQVVIEPGAVAQYRNYVVAGALRAYVLDEKGVEHTIQFAIDDWWISDYNSYITRQPARMFVEALEDSTLLQITYAQEQALKSSHHKFETLFRMMAEKSAAFFARRIISSLTQTAEERYNEFLETFPLAAQRLPQYAVASYLGMRAEFLSRIRNNKRKKKS